MPKPRRARSRAEWEALVAAWRDSGLSKKAFARRKSLAAATLTWWASRLRRDVPDPPPALVPVRVVGEAAPAAFRVELEGGRTVVVPPAFDAVALQRLVAALEGSAC